MHTTSVQEAEGIVVMPKVFAFRPQVNSWDARPWIDTDAERSVRGARCEVLLVSMQRRLQHSTATCAGSHSRPTSSRSASLIDTTDSSGVLWPIACPCVTIRRNGTYT